MGFFSFSGRKVLITVLLTLDSFLVVLVLSSACDITVPCPETERTLFIILTIIFGVYLLSIAVPRAIKAMKEKMQ